MGAEKIAHGNLVVPALATSAAGTPAPSGRESRRLLLSGEAGRLQMRVETLAEGSRPS
jgi:hypothetical protein